MKRQYISELFISIVICQLAGVIGSMFTFSQITTWYMGINKPFFTPPNWVFGPAWGTLYTLMGIALFLVWQKRNEANVYPAIRIFALQLFLNFIWSILFFGIKLTALAYVEILILWLVIAWNIKVFYRITKPAGWVLLPYLAWVFFASFLNLGVVLLNK